MTSKDSMLLFPILLLAALPALATEVAAPATTQTARGASVQVRADFPPGPGPFPAVVLAPGTGYHMDLPLLEQSARRLTAAGLAVYRFNWAYYTQQPKPGKPSADLAAELEDLKTVLALARREPRVDAARLSVGGKSLGSVVASRVLAADPALRGGLFLTPVCSRSAPDQPAPRSVAQENYPELTNERRPVAFIAGDRDPLCVPALLYRFAAQASGPARVVIIGGNHSFEAAKPEATQRNVAAAAQLAADFIAELSAD